ncbi:MAG: DUF5677 domain-containing protein [Candidatus Sulfotelmatobacter sp.]
MPEDSRTDTKMLVGVGFPDFWQHVHDKYAKFFEAAVELTAVGNEVFNVPLSEPLHKLARHISRMVWNSFGSLMVLVLNGYGADAVKIARGMFEASVTLGYLRLHPELVDDYLDYHFVIQKRFYDFMKESAPDQLKRISDSVLRDMEVNFARVAPKFEARSGKRRTNWAKASFREMAKEVGKEKLYLTFYRFASSMHHSDVGGVFAQTQPLEAEDILDVDIAPSDKWLGVALIIGHGAVVSVLGDYNEITKQGLDSVVERARQLFVEAWGKDGVSTPLAV